MHLFDLFSMYYLLNLKFEMCTFILKYVLPVLIQQNLHQKCVHLSFTKLYKGSNLCFCYIIVCLFYAFSYSFFVKHIVPYLIYSPVFCNPISKHSNTGVIVGRGHLLYWPIEDGGECLRNFSESNQYLCNSICANCILHL